MVVYQKNKKAFLDDVLGGDIENVILSTLLLKTQKSTGAKEQESWRNSLQYMNNVLSDSEMPDDIGVSIEYHIPQSTKRIDFIITGQNHEKKDHAVIIELKQWSKAELTEKDAIVKTPLGKGFHETTHPSYQAWSYAALIEGYNAAVYNGNIELKPCAFLHNYEEDEVITNEFYKEHIDRAPLFLKKDAIKLRSFIKQFVRYGDKNKILYKIDKGEIRPSKTLANSVSDMIKGKQEFVMIDDQKLVYETALSLSKKSTKNKKNVLIVEGGPGTGKSVVAVNLLVGITAMRKLVQYVTKNAAPRAVYESKLTGTMNKTEFSNLFRGSGSFTSCEANYFDTLVIDEAHRLNEKSGMFRNLGENQVKELIHSAKFSVFFIDENQMVTLQDIGTKEEIEKWAKHENAEVHELNLSSQFRCNGSDGYLAFLDNFLQIQETANTDLKGINYDFKIVSSPNELKEIIFEKNKANNSARIVAGYCWNWASRKNAKAFDISIPEYEFKMRWNLTKDGSLWIMKPESVNEIGCIHTCQGLEVDYVGVIIGPDLIVRNGMVITDATKRSKDDKSVSGSKAMMKKNPEKAKIILDRIIKNTYRTLMTRGMKGCYLWSVDEETNEWFRRVLG